MVHTKFQGHRPFGSGEEDFLRILLYKGMFAILINVTLTIWTNFRSLIPGRRYIKFSFYRPVGYWEKEVENIESERFGPRSMIDLDPWYSYRFMHTFSWLHLPTLISKTTIVSEKIQCFTFFPIRVQIWPCRKIGEGHSRVIIITNLVVFQYPMLHTNFQSHRPFGSREDDCFLCFYHIWVWRPYWSCDLNHVIKFSFPHPMEAAHKI